MVGVTVTAITVVVMIVLVVVLIIQERCDERPACLSGSPAALGGSNPPPPGAWCRACHGTRWWTERHEPKGWRCMTCHPPADAIRREG